MLLSSNKLHRINNLLVWRREEKTKLQLQQIFQGEEMKDTDKIKALAELDGWKIRDDGKGRLDIGSNMRGLNINVVLINERIKQAQEAKQKVLANSPVLEAQLV